MQILKPALRVSTGCKRAYIAPASWLFTELFNPEQCHMLAVSEGLKLFHGLGNGSLSWTASVIGSTLLVRTVIASPLYTYTEKNQARVTRAYVGAVDELSRNAVRTNMGTVDSKLALSVSIVLIFISILF